MRQEYWQVMEVVLLMIEENSMEKNPDEITTMESNYSKQQRRKNKPRDLMMVEIVGKMHDEENRHRGQIMSKRMMY